MNFVALILGVLLWMGGPLTGRARFGQSAHNAQSEGESVGRATGDFDHRTAFTGVFRRQPGI